MPIHVGFGYFEKPEQLAEQPLQRLVLHRRYAFVRFGLRVVVPDNLDADRIFVQWVSVGIGFYLFSIVQVLRDGSVADAFLREDGRRRLQLDLAADPGFVTLGFYFPYMVSLSIQVSGLIDRA